MTIMFFNYITKYRQYIILKDYNAKKFRQIDWFIQVLVFSLGCPLNDVAFHHIVSNHQEENGVSRPISTNSIIVYVRFETTGSLKNSKILQVATKVANTKERIFSKHAYPVNRILSQVIKKTELTMESRQLFLHKKTDCCYKYKNCIWKIRPIFRTITEACHLGWPQFF